MKGKELAWIAVALLVLAAAAVVFLFERHQERVEGRRMADQAVQTINKLFDARK